MRTTTRHRNLALGAALALLATAATADAQSPWADLGLGLAGSAGTPTLSGSGSLIGGANYGLELSGAAPSSSAFLVYGASRVDLPVAGGVLVPSPDAVAGPLVTTAAGELEGEFAWNVERGRLDGLWLEGPATSRLTLAGTLGEFELRSEYEFAGEGRWSIATE